MTKEKQPRPLPVWLMALGSLFVLGHFIIIGARVLNVQSGPWPTPYGESTALPPQFATSITVPAFNSYLVPLHMTHDYHFMTNEVSEPEAKLEVRLFDSAGKLKETVHLPGETSNPWLAYRYRLLSLAVLRDNPVQRNFNESVNPKDKVGNVEIWGQPDAKGISRLTRVSEQEIPQTGASQPRPFTKVVVQSYISYLCKEHGASSGELIRRSKQAVQPSLLLLQEIPRLPFDELAVSFGKMTP